MSIVISGVNNNDKITASDGTIDLLSGVTYNSEITVPSLKLGSNIQLGNAGIITATTFAGNISGTTGTFGDFVNIGSNIQLGNAGVVTATTFVGNVTGNVNNTGNLLLQIGGGEKVRITSTGRVGINSTNPSAPLEIYTAASAAWKFRIDTTVSDGVGFYQRANGDFEMVLRDASNNVNYIAGTSGALQFATSGSERPRIASDGKVGINITGSDNTSPVRNLDIADSSGAILRLISTDDSLGANERLGEIEFYSDDDDNAHIGAFVKAIADSSDAAGRRTALLFGTQNHDASVNAVEKLRIDCNGKLGLGTNNPQKNLHVYASSVATLRIETGDSRGQAWDILSTNGSGTNTGTLSFRNEAGSSYLDLAANGGSPKTTIRNGGSNDLLVVDNNGYVTQPYLPSFMAYGNSSYTTISAGANLIPYVFPNTAHNTGNHYNTTSGKFTAPVTGVYQLNWNIFCKSDTNQTSAATIEFYVQKNGGNVGRLHNKKGYGNMGDDQQIINLHVFEKLNANDEIRIAVYAYTVDWKIYGGHSTFSGALIG